MRALALLFSIVSVAAACSTTASEALAPPLGPCGSFTADSKEPTSPLEHGRDAIDDSLARNHVTLSVSLLLASDPSAMNALVSAGLTLDARAESYAVVPAADGSITVVGRDEIGAMYGAFDVSEWIDAHQGAAAMPASSHAPSVSVRAANLFLALPVPGETSWWFRSRQFWVEYLDMMARARFDVLDAHGMYNPVNAEFPSALLYFGFSESEPRIGVSAEDRECNRAALTGILNMAAARGIRVGLMTYSAGTSLGSTVPVAPEDDAVVATYTRESARDLATNFPSLWRLGFRIGETKRDASFFASTFVKGVIEAKTGVPIATRSWGTTKAEVLSIAALGGLSTVVEVKYNGEQIGPPYAVAGGSFTHWANYSYEDYLTPPVPYQLLYQVRSAGTHRGLRYLSFDRARQTALALSGTSPRAAGFTFESGHGYMRGTDAFVVAAADQFSPWTFERDELAYQLFGRLAYEPTVPESTVRAVFDSRVGSRGLWDCLQAAGEIVPLIQTGETCGPDGGDYAPDLEWGGSVGYWAAPADAALVADGCKRAPHGPFDTFAFATPYETAADLVAGRATTKVSSNAIANRVLVAVQHTRDAAAKVTTSNAESRDYLRECVAHADLGEAFAHKLRAATALAVVELSANADYLSVARQEIAASHEAWRKLAEDTAYIAPFPEPIRMAKLGAPIFHWRSQLTRLSEDDASIDAIASLPRERRSTTLPPALQWLDAERPTGPGVLSFSAGKEVSVRFELPLPPDARVNLLYKRFEGNVDWIAIPAETSGDSYRVTAPGPSGLYAVEVATRGGGWRYPDVFQGAPYVAVSP